MDHKQMTLGQGNRLSLTLDELSRYQNQCAKHFSFSLTLACPLSCKHCLVGAGPDQGHTTMPFEDAQVYASQMEELYTCGVRSIGFTGGEALLASKQVGVISQKAAEAGLVCGIVTSGYFFRDERAIRTLVKKYPGIQVWNLSIDAYHLEFVAKEQIKLAYEVIKSMGLKVDLRLTYHAPATDMDQEILDYLQSFAEPDDLSCQKIRKYGRARELDMPGEPENIHWTRPCVTQGVVIRYDGSVAPCCCSLVESRLHPFQFGNARERKLKDIYRDFMCHPLLQHIRLLGFSELIRWLTDSSYFEELPDYLPDDICDLCPVLFNHPTISRYLDYKAATPENVLRTAVATFRLMQEKYMLEDALDRFIHLRGKLEGYEQACELLQHPENFSVY
ncbi:MAG: radical SAM/SPASM domain-containing protein [Bacillota bacterium]